MNEILQQVINDYPIKKIRAHSLNLMEEDIICQWQVIMAPYFLEVKEVAWRPTYQIADGRLTVPSIVLLEYLVPSPVKSPIRHCMGLIQIRLSSSDYKRLVP